MSSTAAKLITLGSIGGAIFVGTLAMDIYAAARPGAFSPAGWAPVGIHSLLMTASSVPGATALIGWLLQRRNDEVYTAAYRHGCQDTLNALTVEETAPVRLHQRRASQYPSA